MPSCFNDKGHQPNEAALSQALGHAKRHWDELLELLAAQHEHLAGQWKFYGPKQGWQLKLVHKKRALLYLIPSAGRFTAALALRDDAVARLREHGVPSRLVEEIRLAKPSPEGQPARVEVVTKKHAAIVAQLVASKLGN